MTTTMQKAAQGALLDLEDIQGFVLSAYSHLPAAAYVFLRMDRPTQAREWLKGIVPQVLSAARWPKGSDGQVKKPETALNLAFTPEGLERLNVPLDGFLTEFREGIAPAPSPDDPGGLSVRSHRLGDIGPSAPTNWEYGGQNPSPIHLFLLLFAPDQTSLQEYLQLQRNNWELFGLNAVAEEFAYRPTHGREPFGYRDGISQPGIEGFKTKNPELGAGEEAIHPGEFLLGYLNEYNYLPPVPDEKALSRNSTYLVYRKLEQDVVGFWNFIYATAKQDPKLAEHIASKFVGRWRSGAPLTLSPKRDNPALAADPHHNNAFQYVANGDEAGYGCPIGSHIRRSNPRDSLQPDPDASKVAVRRHRIVRRGRVYGPEYPEDVVEYLTQIKTRQETEKFVADSDKPRGLIFIALNTDLKRQFEFIQQTWINDPKFNGLYDNKDPLLGSNNEDEVSNMTIQQKPIRQQIQNIPRFVTVRAGGYFYLPSITGLRYIAGE